MLYATSKASGLDRAAVLSKAAINAGERLKISGRVMAEMLGVSEAQMSRLRQGATLLTENSKSFELAVLWVRVFRSLDAITGGDETVSRQWMVSANTALGDKPIDRIVTAQGLVDVVTYLDARRASL